MARKRKGNPVNGWINLDKPAGMTSTQAVGRVRRLLNAQKAGHAGTLDPLATGILPIALGEATKTVPFAQDRLKTYRFTVRWGERRDTDDCEGEVIETSARRPSEEDIEALLPAFTGEIEQIPPRFSAVKIDGQRAYTLARDGEDFEIKPRKTYVARFDLLAAHTDEADFEVFCGKGTYIRALARDMAEKLGTCGHVSALRRTRVGPFTQENAISLDLLEQMGDSAARNQALLPLQTALDDIPALALRQEEAARLRSGQKLALLSRPDFQRLSDAGWDDEEERALATLKGQPVALLERQGPQLYPVRVFNV